MGRGGDANQRSGVWTPHVDHMTRLSNPRILLRFLSVAALATTALAALPGLAGGRAEAQMFYGAPILNEHQLLRLLQRQGYREMTMPVLNRDVYVLDAIGPRGGAVRLIVSAFNGSVVDTHPQARRWTRVDPDDEDENVRPWRHRRDWRRWGPEPQARLPHREWQDDDESGLPEVDPTPNPQPNAPHRPPRKPPERVTVAPLPPPVAAAPRDPDLPVPTLKNPTVVKRSPTAIPKDPAEKTEPKRQKPPVVSTAPTPGVGTRDKPRIIELTPKPPVTAAPAPVAAPPAPKAIVAAPPATPKSAPTTAMPPPAILDAPAAAPSTPTVPPAPLE